MHLTEWVEIQALASGFWRVQVNYGFKNTPDIPAKALELCKARPINLFETSYFLSRTIVPHQRLGYGALARTTVRPNATQRRQRGRVL